MNYQAMSYKDQKKSLIVNINKFINHSDAIYKYSRNTSLKSLKMIDKINVLRDRFSSLNTFIELITICKSIYAVKQELGEILPNPNNNSFKSSRDKLNDIILFCSSIINNQ